ncbi:MAG: peptidase [Faecalibacterium sp.]|nr:peptidase [Faecalibacterium sp.]
MNKKVSVSMMITTVIIAMTVTFSITMVMAMRLFDSTVASVKEKESMYNKIAELDKYVRANDYYAIDETTLYDTMTAGYLLGTGDRYAHYYPAAAYTELLDVQNGKKIGVGVELIKDSVTGFAQVTKVYNGSPAADLGMTVGCYITTIDGIEVKGISTADAIEARLRDESGTVVELGWLTELAEVRTDTITRRGYNMPSVEYQLLNESYGYLRILRFDDTTASRLDYALGYLTRQGAKSLIVDLRDNAGGELEATVECIDLICPAGDIASIRDKNGAVTLLGESDARQQVTLPIVCVVNKNTASAAELFAYCARAMNGAMLVGEATLGKGTVQSSPHRMSDGSAVVVTVGVLLACDGQSFDGTGLPVDVERVLAAEEQAEAPFYTPDTDPQVQRALDLAGTLTGQATVGGEGAASSSASSQPETDVPEGDSASSAAAE